MRAVTTQLTWCRADGSAFLCLHGNNHHGGDVGELGSPTEHRTTVHPAGLIEGLAMLLGWFGWFAHGHFLHAHYNRHSPVAGLHDGTEATQFAMAGLSLLRR